MKQPDPAIKFESLDSNVKSALSIVTKPIRHALPGNPAASVFWNTLSLSEQNDWLARG
jgi:hypothetical protein